MAKKAAAKKPSGKGSSKKPAPSKSVAKASPAASAPPSSRPSATATDDAVAPTNYGGVIEHNVSLERLHVDPANARRHPERNMQTIMASLRKHGQVEPLVVREDDGQIVGGNGRYEAMRLLGWTRCTVTWVDKSAIEAMEMGITLNRSGEQAEWDLDVLDRQTVILEDAGVDLADLGFTGDELDGLLDVGDGGEENDEVDECEPPEMPVDPVAQSGDVWLLGDHTVRCGDSSKQPPPDALDIVFTDPPYGVDYSSRVDEDRKKPWGGIVNDNLEDKDLLALLRASVPEAAYRFICCDWHCYSLFEAAFGKPKAVCVWDKGHFGLGKGYRRQHEFVMFYGTLDRTDLSDVWPFSRASDYEHPTQKPVGLVAKALGDVGGKGAVVYDPFGGSGTTLLAAEQLGMVAHLVEIDPRYVDVTVARWEKLTGNKAVRQPAEPTPPSP